MTSAERQRQWRKQHPGAQAAYNKKWRQNHPEYLEVQQRYRKANRTRLRNRAQWYRAMERMELIAAYGGPICVCCGEEGEEFLTLEHSFRDGARQREDAVGGRNRSGSAFTWWLKARGYPQNLGLEILCANCQTSRMKSDGTCAHERD